MTVRTKSDKAQPATDRVDWAGLRVFLYVAESGNLSGAARRLGVSQPEVARFLRDLENRMTMDLFVRQPTGLELTEAGTRVRDLALSMQRSAIAVGALLSEYEKKPGGRVRLSMPQGVAAFWVAPRLPRLLANQANLKVSITSDEADRDQADIAIQYDAHKFGEHSVEPLATVHFAPFASRQYCERFSAPQSQGEMSEHHTVQLTPEQLQRVLLDRRSEPQSILAEGRIETDCAAVVLMSVLSSGGIASMPTCAAAFAPDLVMLGERATVSPALYLVVAPAIAESERVRPVVRWLKEIFDPRANPWFQAEFIHPRHFSRRGGEGLLVFEAPP